MLLNEQPGRERLGKILRYWCIIQALTWSGRGVVTPSDAVLGLSIAAIAEQ